MEDGDIVLDFFAGSCTTAHAVMQLNAEDGGNRKFVMIQLPEKTDEDSEAYKAGYKTIADIGKERIRRAAKMINDELLMMNEKNAKKEPQLFENNSPLTIHNSPLDTGFRVYKTDSSNMKDIFYHPEEITQASLDDYRNNIKKDRSAEDILTQVMLDLGLELSLPIETKDINGNKVFFVQHNSLVACFDQNIDFNIVDDIAKVEPLKVVFRDACFRDDKDRINVEERFKRLSPETVVNVI
jgi:adenine-specific DNA-methyltransferase